MADKIKRFIKREIIPWVTLVLFLGTIIAVSSFFIWLDKVRFVF